MKKLLLIMIILLLAMPAQAKRVFNEKYYQHEWCKKWHGQAEYRLPDGTRVDVLTRNCSKNLISVL